jgi:flagellar M-ring protein FliF
MANAQALAPRLPGINQLPIQQKFGLMLAAAAIVALLVGAWLWSRTPDYRVLYTNLSERDGGAIVAALDQMQVPYRFSDGGGALMVPAEQVHAVRLRLAGQGLPKGSLVGFEAMDNQKLGTSQFAEQINYQRALEGELARSVQSISAVQSARVHLAIPKPTIFVREQQKPSASVLVNLYPGKSLDPAQVSAVVHLVANSVPELAPTNISVLDQNGNLLSQPSDSASGANRALEPGQLKYVRDMELALADRVRAILTPIMGPNNVQAQVTADIDFSETETVAESYKPNQNKDEAAVRSQQSSESSNNSSANGGGVPGALSNQPAAQASAPIAGQPNNGAAGASQNGTASSRRDTTTNYEVDKTTKHTRDALGRLKRLSVAVVVNHRQVTDSKGKVTHNPLPKAEVEQITNLVKDAIGFNKDRGDSVNVVNSSFATLPTAPIEALPLWKQPDTIAMGKDVGKHLLIAGVLLYLVLGVIRPLIRTLATPPALVTRGTDEMSSDVRQEPSVGDVASLPAPQTLQLDNQLQKTRELAKQDPQMVASVLKNWMGSNGE